MIGDNVKVGIGAIIVGPIRIGNNVTIGAGAVVVKDVADGETVAGNPARALPPMAIVSEIEGSESSDREQAQV